MESKRTGDLTLRIRSSYHKLNTSLLRFSSLQIFSSTPNFLALGNWENSL